MKEQLKPDYSQEVKEILLRRPAWHIRWGIPLIVGAFVIVLVIARFIPYPERLTLPVTTSGDTARIILNPSLVPVIGPGTEIELIRKDTDPPSRVSVKVRIDRVAPGSKGTGPVAMVRIPGRLNPSDPARPEFTVMVRVKESNLLSEIFKPVVQVISHPVKGSNK